MKRRKYSLRKWFCLCLCLLLGGNSVAEAGEACATAAGKEKKEDKLDVIRLERAFDVTRRAFIPGDRLKFQVGTVLVFASGCLVEGANVKMPNGLTMCAERVALYSALTDGADQRDPLRDIYVANHKKAGSFPCGICLQALVLVADEKTRVIYYDDRGVMMRVPIKKLLPYPYISADFEKIRQSRVSRACDLKEKG